MISSVLRRLARFAWYLPGFLLWASFPPMGETTDCLFALAPLLWLARNDDAQTNVRRWFLNGLVFWIATLAWMPAIVKNGGPWPLVVLGWAGLAAYCAAYFAAFGYLAARYWRWAREGGYARRIAGLLFVEPILWAGLEIVRSRFLGGFAWNQLGVAAVNAGFAAPAAIGGVYLLSACVVLVNGTFASIAERMVARRSSIPSWVRSIETLLPFLAIWGVFAVAKPYVRVSADAAPDSPGATLGVAMVQRNFPCCFQGPEENPIPVYSNLLTHVSLLKPELVVLPESAMAEFGPVDRPGAVRFARYVHGQTGAAVLAGGTRFGDGETFNSAALYSAQDPSSPAAFYSPQVYDKVHLVPFGEFIPGDKLFPALQRLAPVGSCTPGELKLLRLERGCGDDVPLGVAICFEDTDSAQVRRLASMGAQALVFITNDSWFSHSVEAVQHAWQATARAAETGLAIVRVGNSGVTGTVSPAGRPAWLVGADGKPLVDARGTLYDRVPLATDAYLTPYVVLGDTPLFVAFLLIFSILMGGKLICRLRPSR